MSSKLIFVNLPVSDLASSTRFYEALGCVRNDMYSGDTSAAMAWSDTITIQLLTSDYFATFTPKQLADANSTTEVLIALSFDSREDVDAAVEAAVAAGGRTGFRDVVDLGFWYNRAVEDPDGHIIEALSMSMDMPAE